MNRTNLGAYKYNSEIFRVTSFFVSTFFLVYYLFVSLAYGTFQRPFEPSRKSSFLLMQLCRCFPTEISNCHASFTRGISIQIKTNRSIP